MWIAKLTRSIASWISMNLLCELAWLCLHQLLRVEIHARRENALDVAIGFVPFNFDMVRVPYISSADELITISLDMYFSGNA